EDLVQERVVVLAAVVVAAGDAARLPAGVLAAGDVAERVEDLGAIAPGPREGREGLVAPPVGVHVVEHRWGRARTPLFAAHRDVSFRGMVPLPAGRFR